MAASYWDKFTQQRVSRRRVLQGTGVAAAAGGAILVVGCGGGGGGNNDKTPGAATATPKAKNADEPDILNPGNPAKPGGKYLGQQTNSFETFDPHTSVAALGIIPRIYNVLVNQSPTKPEFFTLDLAESYENVDDVTWNFKIRPGVRIAPNDLNVPVRDLDAQDVLATFERIRTTDSSTNAAFVKGFIDRITAQGDTVTIKTKDPYAWFLNRIGIFVNTIPPRELVANPDKMKTRGVGGGPFQLLQSTEGEGAQLQKNPNYYRKDEKNNNAQLPYWDGIDVAIVRDKVSQRTAFVNEQRYNYDLDSKQEGDGLGTSHFVDSAPSFSFISLTMNPERDPFKDARVRRAFSRAINRQQYIELIYNGDAKADGLVHWPLGSYALSPDELDKLQPYDVGEARRLVQEVGGVRVPMIYPSAYPGLQHDKHLDIFLEQMRDANIEIEQQPQDFNTWLSNYRTLNYASSLSLNLPYETPEVPLDFHGATGPTLDRSFVIGLNDPDIEAVIKKTKTTLNNEARIEAVREAQRVIYSKDPAMLQFVSRIAYTAYNTKIKNFPAGIGTSATLLNTAWLDV